MNLRRWPSLLALCACLALTWPILQILRADLVAEADPERALAAWPRDARALAAAGPARFARGDVAGARAAGQALIANSPLAGIGYRLLAQGAEHAGDTAQARILFRQAARRAPRDRVSQGWLAVDAATHGDFDAALVHMDVLLRVAPGLFDALAPSLATFVALPEARAALLRRLGDAPTPWRTRFLGWFAARVEAAALVDALFSPLRQARQPLAAAERAAWVDRLFRDGEVTRAHFLWIEGLPAPWSEAVGNVFDGGFEGPTDLGGFGWRLGRVPGASIRFEPALGAGGRQALVLDFHDRRVPFNHVQQRLALPAGSYDLRGRVRLDGLRNERGLVWQVACLDGRELGRSDRFAGSAPWQSFVLRFERPADHCAGQVLTLRLDARIAPEQMIGGRILFDDLRIVAVD